MKRLDLDAARSKQKKAKAMNSNVPMAMADVNFHGWHLILILTTFVFFQSSDTELRHAQTEFDRQLEITRLLLDGLNNSHVNLIAWHRERKTDWKVSCAI